MVLKADPHKVAKSRVTKEMLALGIACVVAGLLVLGVNNAYSTRVGGSIILFGFLIGFVSGVRFLSAKAIAKQQALKARKEHEQRVRHINQAITKTYRDDRRFASKIVNPVDDLNTAMAQAKNPVLEALKKHPSKEKITEELESFFADLRKDAKNHEIPWSFIQPQTQKKMRSLNVVLEQNGQEPLKLPQHLC